MCWFITDVSFCKIQIGFLRKDKAGTTTLAILNPDREEGEESRKINLGLLTGRLPHGTASIPGFKEDKRNKALPGEMGEVLLALKGCMGGGGGGGGLMLG